MNYGHHTSECPNDPTNKKRKTTLNWRQQAKILGIPLYHKKKADVLREIKAETGVQIVAEESIEPIPKHEKYEFDPKNLTPVGDLMERLDVIEDRVNRLIDALVKSKRVKGI